MPTSCQDVTAKMMELLYEELPAGQRASIDGHVAECGRCRAELEGFQRARAVARQVLDDAPPARSREAILRAAAAAAAEVRATPPGQWASARAAAARFAENGERPPAPSAKPRRERSSFWAWLRGGWTLPTLATVGAVAVFVLGSRLFMDPVKTYERGREALAPAPALEPPTSGGSAAAARPAGTADDQGEGSQAEAPAGELPPASRGPGAAASAAKPASNDEAVARGNVDAKRKREQPPRQERDAAKRAALKDTEQDGLSGLIGRSDGGAQLGIGRLGGVGSGVARAATPNDRFAAPPPPRANSEAKPEKKAARGEPQAELAAARPAFAPPPASSAAAPATAPALDKDRAPSRHKAKADDVPGPLETEEKPKVAAKRMIAADPLDSGGGRTSPAPTAAAPAPAAEAASEGSAGARAKGGKAFADPPSETLRARADRLFADGRWAEAAAAYRELLRTEPDSPDAERWRQRLALTAQAESEAQARPARAAAKAAKRPAADKQPAR